MTKSRGYTVANGPICGKPWWLFVVEIGHNKSAILRLTRHKRADLTIVTKELNNGKVNMQNPNVYAREARSEVTKKPNRCSGFLNSARSYLHSVTWHEWLASILHGVACVCGNLNYKRANEVETGKVKYCIDENKLHLIISFMYTETAHNVVYTSITIFMVYATWFLWVTRINYTHYRIRKNCEVTKSLKSLIVGGWGYVAQICEYRTAFTVLVGEESIRHTETNVEKHYQK